MGRRPKSAEVRGRFWEARASGATLREAAASTGYRAVRADRMAQARTRRPRPPKLAQHPELRAIVEQRLAQRWSPQQISRRLELDFPRRPVDAGLARDLDCNPALTKMAVTCTAFLQRLRTGLIEAPYGVGCARRGVEVAFARHAMPSPMRGFGPGPADTFSCDDSCDDATSTEPHLPGVLRPVARVERGPPKA